MNEELSPEEIETLGEKIGSFAASLSDRERDAFATSLWNGESDEVEGFGKFDPVGRTFEGLKFTPGAAKIAFPAVPHKGPVGIKPSPSE